jgi:hypothetical protein
MVKVKSFAPPLLLVVVCILTLASHACADELLPPSFLTAVSDQDGQVPLFWFAPNPDTAELAYDDGFMDHPMYAVAEWHHNCLAVKMTSPEAPFYLLKSKIFISYQGAELDSSYDYQAPFFVTVNLDSGGIPKNTFLDSVWGQATGEDSVGVGGQWVEVEHSLLMDDSLDFWIVFHWLEETPQSPLAGGDNSSNQSRSFWGMKNSPHFEWHQRSDFNIMMRAVVALNKEVLPEVDSFKIYRSSSSGVPISSDNLIASVPISRFQYTNTNVINDQPYYYAATSWSLDGESEGSNQAWATPRKAAELVIDPNSFDVSLISQGKAFGELTLTNSGGLPLDFDLGIDAQEQTWMGGSDKFGYTWTDKNLQDGPDYSWIDITGFGEEFGDSGDNDENYGFFSLGFPFPFYGNLFDSLRISSNGWISFSDAIESVPASYVNKPLPWLWGPYNLIAPLWDDLILSHDSRIHFYSNESDSSIISFVNLRRCASGGRYTLQTILTENGEIAFQYHALGDSLSATVGIQNQDGTLGLEVIWNEDYLEDSLWVKIMPSWVSVDSMKGTIQPGEGKILNLTFDRLSYPQGVYHADLTISSWDKNHLADPVEIPLTLCIDTTTWVDFEEDQRPIAFVLFQNYPNPFNPVTIIRYAIGRGQKKPADGGQRTADGFFAHTTLKIYNTLGQKVRTLVDGPIHAGSHQVLWDGKDEEGKDVASGVYFYQLTAGDYKKTRKMTLLR